MATMAEIKEQRDLVSAAVDGWVLAADSASADATAAASAGAQAETAQQAADDSAALADQKKTEAQAEAQKLADMIGEPSEPTRRRKT